MFRLLGVLCLVGLGFATAYVQADEGTLRVNGVRLNATMETMKTFGSNADGGSDRIAFSQHNKDALDYLAELMREAGLEPHIDVAGNLVGVRAGTDAAKAPIVTGSHIDTVINGGHYDGIAGVMAGIEAARTLDETNTNLAHPLHVVIWTNEEAGKVGSRSYAGTVEPREMNLTALGDVTIGDGIRFLGGDPDRIQENAKKPGDIAAYIELHVEQGAILDANNIQVGVVDGIVGIRRWNVTIDGYANHAGTTPMNARQDALYAAAQLVTTVRDVINGEPGAQVGTVGRLHVEPGVPNVVPGKVTMSIEIRDLSMEKIARLFAQIETQAVEIGDATDTKITFDQYYLSPAAVSDVRISEIVEKTANDLGLSSRHMPSGAGHDAQSFKDIAPLGMIFVPSVNGVSHAPDEVTYADAITNGANMLLNSLIKMDKRFD